MRLIVGLGNPGTEYEWTRHNLGFLVVAHLARSNGLKFQASRLCRGMTAEGRIGDQECCLLLPMTMMNNSGAAVRPLAERNEIASESILVVCDDFQLPLGRMRLRRKGSSGGHNGLTSIIEKLDTEDFPRLRLGIGPVPRGQKHDTDFVLGEFSAAEKKQVEPFIVQAADCCAAWLTEEIGRVMSQFNAS